MTETKKILIADDHTIVSKGLTYLFTLNFSNCIITEVPSIKDTMKQLNDPSFTHLILDVNLIDGNTMDYIPKMLEQNPLLQILVYSMMSEEIYGKKVLDMGTSGFLSKASSEVEVMKALKIFIEGGIYKSNRLKAHLSHNHNHGEENSFFKLTVSELRVLNLILKGKRTKEISGELNVADQTIATFKSRIFKKLDTENIFEIMKLAELNGINLA